MDATVIMSVSVRDLIAAADVMVEQVAVLSQMRMRQIEEKPSLTEKRTIVREVLQIHYCLLPVETAQITVIGIMTLIDVTSIDLIDRGTMIRLATMTASEEIARLNGRSSIVAEVIPVEPQTSFLGAMKDLPQRVMFEEEGLKATAKVLVAQEWPRYVYSISPSSISE